MAARTDWVALGTTATLLVTDPRRLAAARRAVQRVLDDVDGACSRFRPDAELVAAQRPQRPRDRRQPPARRRDRRRAARGRDHRRCRRPDRRAGAAPRRARRGVRGAGIRRACAHRPCVVAGRRARRPAATDQGRARRAARPRRHGEGAGRRPGRRARRRGGGRHRGARQPRRGHRRRGPVSRRRLGRARRRRPPGRALRARADGRDRRRRPRHVEHHRAHLGRRGAPHHRSALGTPGGRRRGAPSASPPPVAWTRTSPAPGRSCTARRPRGGCGIVGFPPAWCDATVTSSPSRDGPPRPRRAQRDRDGRARPVGLVVRDAWRGRGDARAAQRVRRARHRGGLRRWQPPAAPRFAVASLHRTVSLLAVAMLVLHIATTVIDPFPKIALANAVVPFAAGYRPLWLGLGTIAGDVLLAVALTSLVRRRLGYRTWRAVHWAAYACWPVAVAPRSRHRARTPARAGWWSLTAACVRPSPPSPSRGWAPPWSRLRCARRRAAVLVLAVAAAPPGSRQGPLASGWARRAGTPPSRARRVRGAVAGRGGRDRDALHRRFRRRSPVPCTPVAAPMAAPSSTCRCGWSARRAARLRVRLGGRAPARRRAARRAQRGRTGTGADPGRYQGRLAHAERQVTCARSSARPTGTRCACRSTCASSGPASSGRCAAPPTAGATDERLPTAASAGAADGRPLALARAPAPSTGRCPRDARAALVDAVQAAAAARARRCVVPDRGQAARGRGAAAAPVGARQRRPRASR